GNKPKSADIEQQTQNFGKFKNPNELLHAYCELEKEFTKRSQRLAMLENGVKKLDGNAKSSQDEGKTSVKSEASGGESVKSEIFDDVENFENATIDNEKLSKNNAVENAKLSAENAHENAKSKDNDTYNAIETEDEWRAVVDKFFDETPTARPFAKDIALELILNPSLKENPNCLNNALTRVLINNFKTPQQMLNNGEFLNDYVLKSDVVKSAVINSYLLELENGKPPVTLSNGGIMSAAPKSKPKSLEEAGVMFLKNNKQ
ncbi:MAG: hypothetical protein RR405_05690, partial [Clostridia bacterium]